MIILNSLVHEKDENKDTYMEECYIKTAIEFCLQLQISNFLFTELYDFFLDKDFQDEFVQ